ncbi:type 2 isopentenyl-diphosphate Delta-isomerase [Miniphocaeibacter halophilus]|uniref:Type 2 isopentenyl-diphosphate Delta-isomerase n=1 Tax=Miniphocaeibacter halophilus TaxID=2931922 RepID=A0AC61MR58_9FIRM|nr:type 2 isopentenyl-diphosphate Delta-isomerase [Miniphocaeibacter halophilus]QQK08016.1 type 2 isopentenyl-diphosphate Delta-isomerase [Miniphocaeibacter halophilus]
MRLDRKKEHIENYLKSDYKGETLFEDIYIENNALPEVNLDEIDTSMKFLGKNISFPLMINAITGGGEELADINEDLARLAKIFNIPMAVGSQTVAIEREECKSSFEIVRDIIGKDNIVIGNISANAPIENFLEASKMIDADAMQVHLNVAQELFMEEGDKHFRGIKKNISKFLEVYDKPIIVKEVGFGISKKVACELKGIGVKYIDVAGAGGTNFIEIEDIRNFSSDYSDLYEWGIPTAKALIECRGISDDLFIVSSGGIKTAQDIVKSLVVGGNLTAISGEILLYLMHGGFDAAKDYVESLIRKTKILMVLLGKKNIKELTTVEYKITGYLKELINP